MSSGYDISGFQLGADSPFTLLDEAGIDESEPRVSADGAWLAYFVSSVYDVHPDCETFIMLRDDEEERRDIVVVTNFFEELRERVGN